MDPELAATLTRQCPKRPRRGECPPNVHHTLGLFAPKVQTAASALAELAVEAGSAHWGLVETVARNLAKDLESFESSTRGVFTHGEMVILMEEVAIGRADNEVLCQRLLRADVKLAQLKEKFGIAKAALLEHRLYMPQPVLGRAVESPA
jgi:hypothetical protein